MAYVEFLRVRKIFYYFAGIISALVAFLLISLITSHGGSGNGSFRLALGGAVILQKGADGHIHPVPIGGIPGVAVPLGALFAIAAYAAAIFATIVSTSLYKEHDGLDFPLTRPVSREGIALAYFAVDLLAVAAAYAFALLVMCLVPLAVVGLLGRITVSAQSWLILATGLGVSFMWYGLIQAVTARLPAGGGLVAGGSWAFFGVLLLLPGATFLGPLVHGVVVALNYLNPLAYFNSVSASGSDVTIVSSFTGLSLASRAGILWALGLAACALAIESWKRIEV